jgi:flagellar hook protein FlgE
MSIYGALFTGISGLNAMSNALSATSNNIANVNTVGYKNDSASFSTLLTTNGSTASFSAGGVQASRLQNVAQQGQIQSAASSTDLAINGNGFFITNTSSDPATNPGQITYTRAGNFQPDGDGILRNSAGLYLMGWQLDSTGNPPANPADLTPINLNNLTGTAQPTTSMALQANLQSSQTAYSGSPAYVVGTADMANGSVTPDFEQPVQFYDGQGGAKQLNLDFLKTGANTWAYEVVYDGTAADVGGNPQVASGTLTFNSDGTLASVTGPSASGGQITASVPFSSGSTGLADQSIDINFGTPNVVGGTTQFDSPSTITSSGADGALFGGLSGVNVSDDGKVIAVFDNGVQRAVYQLPMATFANPDGLTEANGNAYLQSNESGTARYVAAKTGGAGKFASSALEASTVDLGTEFTNLITTQRAYSASAKIITTADQMLQQLLQIKQ